MLLRRIREALPAHWQGFFCVSAIVVLATFATGGMRKLYYSIFPWVLSFNLSLPVEKYTVAIGGWTSEHDGIEIYVVYAFVFAIIALTTVVALPVTRLKAGMLQALAAIVVAGMGIFAIWVMRDIRFTQPLEATPRRWFVLLFGIALVLLARYRGRLKLRQEALIAATILLPVCFVATAEIAISNYVYMLDPAQKLLDGVRVQDIYFQYEFFISAVAAIWMKLGLNETSFQIVGQLSNFVVLLTIFLLGRRLFSTVTLGWYLLLGLVVFRFLGAPWDPVFVFQITPLRLELWLIPFVIIYLRGPYHWLVPAVCGLLVLVHGALGLAYTIGYFQLMLVLALLGIVDNGWRNWLAAFCRRENLIRSGAIALYLLGCFIVARTVFAANIEATGYYQKIGIGFLPLLKTSIFWLLPAVMAAAFVMLVSVRHVVSERYLALGLALIAFCAGNSIYFLGRSHELNIFSISITVIFLLFYTLDAGLRYYRLVTGITSSPWPARGSAALGVALLVAMAYACGAQIEANLKAKFDIVRTMQFYPDEALTKSKALAARVSMAVAKHLPEGATVQFLTYDEVNEYAFYKGPQRSQSFFYPLAASVFVDQLLENARRLLSEGSYLLVDPRVAYDLDRAGLSSADYAYRVPINDYELIGKNPPPTP